MAVYVDDMQPTFKTSRNCWRWPEYAHMWADPDAASLERLHSVARAIGLKREWFQDKKKFPHYDVTRRKRQQALKLGVVEMSLRLWATQQRLKAGAPNNLFP